MNIEERRRAAFESWWAKYAFLSDHEVRQKRQGITYCGVMLAAAWAAWNAALDIVVIEPPRRRDVIMGRRENEYDSGVNRGIEICEDAIESAGVRCKG